MKETSDMEREIWELVHSKKKYVFSKTLIQIDNNVIINDNIAEEVNKYRNKGIGTYIILKLKEYCYSNKQIPVCGCWYPNYPSKKTLEKAGFIANHRVIRFEF